MLVSISLQSGSLISRVLNIGIIAAGFGIFVSLSDFVISSERKKKIDLFIDSLTLRLDYTKTFDWLQRWLKATRRASIASTVFGTIAVLLFLVVLISVEWKLWVDTSWWKLIGIGVLTMALWSCQWSYVSKAYDNVGVPIIQFLAEVESYTALIGCYIAVIVVGMIVVALCLVIMLIGPFLLMNYLVDKVDSEWLIAVIVILKFPISIVAGNFVVGLFFCWIGITIDGAATMLGAFLLFVARVVVESARWVMWRISNYPKGPLTATLTLIGIALTVAKMFTGK